MEEMDVGDEKGKQKKGWGCGEERMGEKKERRRERREREREGGEGKSCAVKKLLKAAPMSIFVFRSIFPRASISQDYWGT